MGTGPARDLIRVAAPPPNLLERAWKLSEKDASCPTATIRASGQRPAARGPGGLVDAGAKGEVTQMVLGEQPGTEFVGRLHQKVLQLGGTEDWTLESLVRWLDSNIEHSDVPVVESAEFLRRVVRGLMAKLGIQDWGTLVLDRSRLRDEIGQRINEHRTAERRGAFQALLLPESPLTVAETCAIDFRAMGYEPSWVYEGGFVFRKHYFGPKPGELREGTEEFACAQFLDDLTEVKYWARNLARKASSLRLQTSKDGF